MEAFFKCDFMHLHGFLVLNLERLGSWTGGFGEELLLMRRIAYFYSGLWLDIITHKHLPFVLGILFFLIEDSLYTYTFVKFHVFECSFPIFFLYRKIVLLLQEFLVSPFHFVV